MKPEDIKNVAVIGLGAMGPGIAQAMAQGGRNVIGYDAQPGAEETCRKVMQTNLNTLVEFEFITGRDAAGAMGRFSAAQSLGRAVENADVVIEAVSENLEVKRAVFEQAHEAARPEALFWSNTSSLNIFELMPAQRQARTLIAHWFLPPHIIPLVEVVKGPGVSSETVEVTLALLKELNKIPILIERYVPGFIINRILRNLGREAFFLLGEGYISAEDLDLAVKASIAPRMMVLGLIQRYDFTGLDLSARNLLDESFFDPPMDNRPAPLQELIDRGDLGVKTGKGFFDYSDRELTEVLKERDRHLLTVMKNLQFCLEKKRLV